MLALLAQVGDFVRPEIDYHAFAPEFVLVGTLVVVLLVDLIKPEGNNPLLSSLAGLGMLGAVLPVITLARDGVQTPAVT